MDALLTAGLTPLSGMRVTALLSEVERERRRLEAVDQRLLAETAARNVARQYGAGSTAASLVTPLRITPDQAHARLNRARDTGSRHSITGHHWNPCSPRRRRPARRHRLCGARRRHHRPRGAHLCRLSPPNRPRRDTGGTTALNTARIAPEFNSTTTSSALTTTHAAAVTRVGRSFGTTGFAGYR